MDLDLQQILRIARQRGWIVGLLVLVAGAVAYYDAAGEVPTYRTSATMVVSQPPPVAVDELQSAITVERVKQTYELMITSEPMRERVAQALGEESIPTSISASIVPDTDLIEVVTTDTDAARAARVANAVVTEFQAYVNEQALERADVAREGLDNQIEQLERRLSEVDREILELDTPENVDDLLIQQRIADLGQERITVNQSLIELSTRSITLDSNMLANSAQVDLAQPAQTPTVPFAPNLQAAMIRGLMAGLLLGIAVVVLLEYLDNTVKPELPLQSLAGAPMLASVPLSKMRVGSEQLFTMAKPHSSAAEAVRLLRTNLEFAAASGSIGSVTVTSPGAGEGKSTICANLAVAMAQAGVKTVLIDADMRKPTQQQIFGVANATGLTTVLTRPHRKWQQYSTKVALPGLVLITSGPVPPNPSDLVSSARFEALLGQIKDEADLVIIDSPPVLAASDALAIATHTDGVILVCQSHATRVDAMRHAVHAVQQGGIRLVGMVLNRQKGQQGSTFHGEYYGHQAATTSS